MNETAAPTHYRFILFVAGDEPNSRLARRNLAALCESELRERHQVEIVDVLRDYERAAEHDILVTPALLVVQPEPTALVLGNLSDRNKVRHALRLTAP